MGVTTGHALALGAGQFGDAAPSATSNSASTTSLFRPQAVLHRQAQALGSIHLSGPIGFSAAAASSLLLGAALVAFAAWGEVSRRATVSGLLLPVGGLIQVTAGQTGIVETWLVREGQQVKAGQPLGRIRSERRTAQGEAGALNMAALAQRRNSLEMEARLLQLQGQQRQDALASRLGSLGAEERQAQGEEEAALQRLQLARVTESRYQELVAGGFMPLAQAQQKQEERLDLQARASTARRSLQALQREQASLQAEMAANKASVRMSLAQVQRALAVLGQEDTEQAARQGGTVVAPQAGRIGAMAQPAGQAVQAGQTLLHLIPNTGPDSGAPGAAMQAVLFAPSRTAGFIKPGQPVWLRHAAYPYQKFGMTRGTVAAVSDSPLAAQDLPAGQAQALQLAAQTTEPLRRVTVDLAEQQVQAYGQALAFKPGQSVEADVLQEDRKVWEWIFEPLLAARQRTTKFLSASPIDTSPGG